MLKKEHRLTGKDINFLYRKQKVVFGKDFGFFMFLQYPNKHYNQISVTIPVKLSKRSNVRNHVKRIIYDFIMKDGFIKKSFNGKYYKIFVIVNQKSIPIIQQCIEREGKKDIRNKINDIFSISFSRLIDKLGKSSAI